jgi:hypothetical protein
MNGYTKPYFTDENGYMFRDETGLTDAGNPIPMMVEFGRTNCGTEQKKTFSAMQIDSERARTGIVSYALDGGSWTVLGQTDQDIKSISFPQGKETIAQGRDINLRFSHNGAGDPPYFNGWSVYFNVVESIVNEIMAN